MDDVAKILNQFEIALEIQAPSAYRTILLGCSVCKKYEEAGVEVFISSASGAAHLPRVVVFLTTRPVKIGVPQTSSFSIDGCDSILSILQNSW
jgi:phosphoribosylaminoimidazole carboxylase PurE protein